MCADTQVGVSLKFTVDNPDFSIISVVGGGAQPSATSSAAVTSSSATESSEPTSSPTSLAAPSTSETADSSKTSTTSQTGTSTPDSSSVASTLSTLISSAVPAASEVPKEEVKEPGRSNRAVYGVSIGVPLAALAIGLGAWAMWERRRRRPALSLQHETSDVKEPTHGWYTSHDRLHQKPELVSPNSQIDRSQRESCVANQAP